MRNGRGRELATRAEWKDFGKDNAARTKVIGCGFSKAVNDADGRCEGRGKNNDGGGKKGGNGR
ncbi:hypothetical protein GJ744_005842 [Endocarpon pusillum]|uniref:Uncharacterized protein n=1 Tax=Endocarpon pusillum TaxID=364733 RepID=A0A8H7DYI5_9EURO|nr:hypothetical protein GJ744_005842 [Endocarpon pusillum]